MTLELDWKADSTVSKVEFKMNPKETLDEAVFLKYLLIEHLLVGVLLDPVVNDPDPGSKLTPKNPDHPGSKSIPKKTDQEKP